MGAELTLGDRDRLLRFASESPRSCRRPAAAGKANAAKDSASIGGSVGSMTGEGKSPYEPREREDVKLGSVGEA